MCTYEAISSTLPGLSVCDDDCFVDASELLEMFAQTVVGGVIRQAADKQLRVRRVLLLYDRCHDDEVDLSIYN